MIRWGAYHMLMWAWVLVPLAWILYRLRKQQKKQLETLIDADVVSHLAPRLNPKLMRNKNILWLGAILLMILALARPQWGYHWDEVQRRGLDIMVVLDTSKSMLTQDVKPNRLQQAKWGIRDLLGKLHGDRVGLISFAGSAFLQCPLTMDYPAFAMMLDDVYAGIIPRGGTAISKALKEAVESFEYDSAADKAIILVTDGEDHDGDPASLIDELKAKGIMVFAIGVGTLEGELIATTDQNGAQTFIKDANNQVVKSALNEEPLRQLAMETGGIYVRSAPGDFGLDQIYDRGINKLQRADQESKMVKIYEDHFSWFLTAAFILLILEAALAFGKKGAKKRIPAITAVLLAGAFLLPNQVRAEENEDPFAYMQAGLTAMNAAGKAEAAESVQPAEPVDNTSTNAAAMAEAMPSESEKQYQQAAAYFEKAADLTRSNEELDAAVAWYNLGNALYKLKQFDKASTAYQNALTSSDLALQSKAYFNQGNAAMEIMQTTDTPTFKTMVEQLDHAMSLYEKSMMLDADDVDAKKNYEAALRLKTGLLNAQMSIQTLISQSRNMVRDGRIVDALQSMQTNMQQPAVQRILQMDQELGKKLQETIQKISDVAKIDQDVAKELQQVQDQMDKIKTLPTIQNNGGTSDE
ncbi:MAG: VWA domain-containing protein [Spartobacteria bacterium]|nr:VWA domain-containing protein [Spartobacteria bacterium]